MFDPEQKDLAATLSEMERRSRERTQFDQVQAAELMKKWIVNDRRYDALDPERLVQRIQHCRGSGSVFDIDDPSLKRGSQPRPPWR